jgi:A nuclease family of the HNH/ENDO VII superfamily with conserved AHH
MGPPAPPDPESDAGPVEAHHIAARAAASAREARIVLQKCGIDVNGARNGVYLPRDFHRRMHTKLYYGAVNDVLSSVDSPEEAVQRLADIGRRLLRGHFP